VLCDSGRVELDHLVLGPGKLAARPSEPPESAPNAAANPDKKSGLREEVRELERERILVALERSNGSQRRTAAELGISRGALIRRMQQLGITPSRKD
jgi:DNA-binding NtrC family response regulator